MIEINKIRLNIEKYITSLKKRGIENIEDTLKNLISLDDERKSLKTNLDNLLSDSNKIAKEIGLAQKNKESIEDLKSKATKISSELKDAKDKFQTNKIEYEDFLLNIPNLLDPSVPFGKSAEDNEVLKEAGMISSFDFTPRDHQELGILADGMDFEAATKISKSRFVIFKN